MFLYSKISTRKSVKTVNNKSLFLIHTYLYAKIKCLTVYHFVSYSVRFSRTPKSLAEIPVIEITFRIQVFSIFGRCPPARVPTRPGVQRTTLLADSLRRMRRTS